MNTQDRTPQQREIITKLSERFQIDPDRILFLNVARPNEPWFPAEELISIARQADVFQSIGEQFDQFIPALNQIVHIATVIDKSGRTFSRSGVATEGEKIPGTTEVLETHDLAASRALSAAMRAAGFYPFRAGSVITNELPLGMSRNLVAEEADSRNKDLAQIHLLAMRKGLITEGVGGRKNMSNYKTWLFDKWGTETAGTLNPVERQSVINALKQLPDADSAIA